MYRVGLTGGIATGKSAVAAMLKDLGAVIIDADQIAREVVLPGEPALCEIVLRFGSEMLLADGSLNRSHLGKAIFSDEGERQALNAILHPRIFQRIESDVLALSRCGYPGPVVLDVPLLIETGMADSVDEVWLVVTDADTQLQRLMARDNLTECEAQLRIDAQMPLADKRQFAHRIIDNNGDLNSTRNTVHAFWQECLNKAATLQAARPQIEAN